MTLGGGLEGGSSSKVNHSEDGASASGGSWPYSLWSSEAVVVTELIVSKDVCRRKWGGNFFMLLISLLLFRYETSPRGCRRKVGGSTGGAGSCDRTCSGSSSRNGRENLRAGLFGGGSSTGCDRNGLKPDEGCGRSVGSLDCSLSIEADRLRAIGGGAASSSSSSESSNTKAR